MCQLMNIYMLLIFIYIYLYYIIIILCIYIFIIEEEWLFYDSLLVSKVSPLLQDEQENKMNIDINLNKMANILNNNKTIKSSMKTIEKGR